MKLIPTSFLGVLAIAAAAVPATWAQTSPTTSVMTTTAAGTREFTLGASGASNKDLDNSFGGASFSYGYFFNEAGEGLIRQSINYSNSDLPGSRQQWNGSTKIAYDQHLAAHGAFRPFIGVNFGGVYGDSVRDTWTAGLEAGAKFYVQSRTFVYATIEYGWFFRHARNLDDRFRDGQFNWTAGVGFNF